MDHAWTNDPTFGERVKVLVDGGDLTAAIELLQARARLTLELQTRMKRAQDGVALTEIALPAPIAAVDAVLALPGVVVEGSTVVSTLNRILRKLGCAVSYDRDPVPVNTLGEPLRRLGFRCYPRRMLDKDAEPTTTIALVPNDVTDEETLEYFPGFIAQALAHREGFAQVHRVEWNRAFVQELRRRLGIVGSEQAKGAV